MEAEESKSAWIMPMFHVASLLLFGLSLSFPCSLLLQSLLLPVASCSGVKAMCCFNGGFHNRRKHLPFLLEKVGLKGLLKRVLLGFLDYVSRFKMSTKFKLGKRL